MSIVPNYAVALGDRNVGGLEYEFIQGVRRREFRDATHDLLFFRA